MSLPGRVQPLANCPSTRRHESSQRPQGNASVQPWCAERYWWLLRKETTRKVWKTLRLNILLHDLSRTDPFGGFKQQYELANRLARIGHDVAIYHSLNLEPRALMRPRVAAGVVRHNKLGRSMVSWFDLAEEVKSRYVPRLAPRLLRSADATIISSARVAEQIPRRSRRTGRLLYVVYEYPVWRHGSAELKQSLRNALRRDDIEYIACGSAVEDLLREVGTTPVAKIICGIDLPSSSDVSPVSARDPVVGFALRPEPYKGAREMMEAIPMVSKSHPQARFECFGRMVNGLQPARGLTMRGYLDDHELQAFYRRCSIFVSASYAEGWGLTAAEAMANGAATIVTDDGGSRDFAIDGASALVIPARDPAAIASAIDVLLRDDELRERIAEGGLLETKKMEWHRIVAAFDALLNAPAGPA